MIFKKNNHTDNLYNILLILSRNKLFYEKIKLSDSFETRIYLMFFHFSIILKIFKKKNKKFDQGNYDFLFHNIENNLRELGFGDVSVNKKMKDLNKIFYDILLKLNTKKDDFTLSKNLSLKYFDNLKDNDKKWVNFEEYFKKYYDFCFVLPDNNMIKEIQNYKF